jgi:hypothetical protein
MIERICDLYRVSRSNPMAAAVLARGIAYLSFKRITFI